ncbi:MAG: DUF2062 domain-containing protein [Planctomycetota bacterium]
MDSLGGSALEYLSRFIQLCCGECIIKLLKRLYLKLVRVWYRLVTLKSSPRKIALGFALGIFIAPTPTLGFQTILALLLSTLFKVNPVSAVLGMYVSNPLTIVPMYALCYRVGAWVLGVPPDNPMDWFSGEWTTITRAGLSWIAVESVGAVIVGGSAAVVGYFVTLWGVVRFRRARLNKRIKKIRERLSEPPEEEE